MTSPYPTRASTVSGHHATGWQWGPAGHSSRPHIESFIQTRFFEEYRARLCHFLPELICLTTDGDIHAAVGFARASGRELYLEQYLPAPVDCILQSATSTVVSRARIVEVGNLASSTPGGSRTIILMLTRYFHEQTAEWVVFTGVPGLLNTFARLGIRVHELGEADPAKLQDRTTDWGSYYASRPKVVAVSVAEAFSCLSHNPVLARLMERVPTLCLDEGRVA